MGAQPAGSFSQEQWPPQEENSGSIDGGQRRELPANWNYDNEIVRNNTLFDARKNKNQQLLGSSARPPENNLSYHDREIVVNEVIAKPKFSVRNKFSMAFSYVRDHSGLRFR